MSSSAKSISQIFAEAEHETVALWSDPSSDYRGIIAIHSTALGPAAGGTRFWHYADDESATLDALRLSRAMSYKNALAGLPFGGGKAVINGANETCNREKLFLAHGRFVESFRGRFITAEDIGTTPSDMDYVRRETRHVAGLLGRSGDPSPITAHGVFLALQACATHRWGSGTLTGRTVAIQGCGNTGYHLAKELSQVGAQLVATDIDGTKLKRVVNDFGALAVSPQKIFGVQADIFAPCALGGVINDETIPELKVEIVVGAANNQLLEPRHGEALEKLGILYGPDYVANAGGVINGCRELLGWNSEEALEKVREIYQRMLIILELAKEAEVAPYKFADQLAENCLARASSVLNSSSSASLSRLEETIH